MNDYSSKNYRIKDQKKSNDINIGNKPITIVNKRKENLDNNDVKQIVNTKNSNTNNNEKPKNYLLSNAAIVKNTGNNKFLKSLFLLLINHLNQLLLIIKGIELIY